MKAAYECQEIIQIVNDVFFVIFDSFMVSCRSTDIYLYFGGVRYFKYLLFSHDDINNI